MKGSASTTAAGQAWVWQTEVVLGRSSEGFSMHTGVESERRPVSNSFCPLCCLGMVSED